LVVYVQFDVQNLTNELFLYNFESVFSGTHVGYRLLQWTPKLQIQISGTVQSKQAYSISLLSRSAQGVV